VIDATNAYWTDNVSIGTVKSVPLGGGTATTFATGQNGPLAIAVDATAVYWANTDGHIMKVTR
jgi:hypothetical protein